jgi:lipoprotein-anchoring transpeptidase ErfK/SrfK
MINHLARVLLNAADERRLAPPKHRQPQRVADWDQGPLGAMYNPVFFNYQGDAIHGETNANVPVNNVSHGCVRIPFDITTWLHKDLKISQTKGAGTEVCVYNQW